MPCITVVNDVIDWVQSVITDNLKPQSAGEFEATLRESLSEE